MRSFLLFLSLFTGFEASPEVKGCNVADEGGCKEPFNHTAYRTAKTTITCDEGNKEDSRFKFFCKENGSICEDILSTKSTLRSNGMFTLTETESGFNVSISNVSPQHAGVYWCGVESTEGSYRAALRKIQLEVKAAIKNFTRSPTIGQNMTYWCQYPEGAPVKKFICFSKNKREAPAAQHEREDYIYEEIQERPQMPDSGNAINTIYSTANFPTNPYPSLRYTTINFRNGSGEAAEVLMTNPSSSACDYSAVKDGQIPTCSNVNQPSPEDPLYSTVNKTQQQ
ncbi:CMRF35-like molecule 6 [Dissostichus eleginoides]|uniref:CMRF35-like molecule 6 n=1 Tax=Dissostichus eleginoides TaxID=100907 RepID=A0AAD9CGR9_DISEL|nr:CMRF35-like molecule 6 [Dissostichus eleginoides]